MPSTAKDPGFGITPAANDSPEEYNRVGKELFAALLNKYGNNMLAVAAYNAGSGTIDHLISKYGDPRTSAISRDDFISHLPVNAENDTQAYVKNILARAGSAGQPGAAREEFRQSIASLPKMTGDQVDTAMEVYDSLANSWAKTEGKTPEDFWNLIESQREDLPTDGAATQGLAQYAGLNATGWQDAQGKFSSLYDGKPRFEISDAGARVKSVKDIAYDFSMFMKGGGKSTEALGDILDHPELYKNYPEAENVLVRLAPGVSGGSFNPGKNTISVGYDPETGKIDRETLLHEVQHWVQGKEGFARGGNMNIVKTLPEYAKFNKMWQEIQPLKKEADRLWKEFEKTGFSDEKLSKAFNEANEKFRTENAKLDKYSSFGLYRRIAGEIEARDTAARGYLSRIGRKHTPPYSSENISPKDAILFQEGEPSPYQSAPIEGGDKNAPILAPNGSLDFGQVSDEVAAKMGGTEGAIRLFNGDESEGAVHIDGKRGEQLKQLGYRSAVDLVSDVSENYDAVFKGEGNTFILAKRTAEPYGTAYIELTYDPEGNFYRVKSALAARKGYLVDKTGNYKRKLLWEGAPSLHQGAPGPDAQSVGQSSLSEPNLTRAASKVKRPLPKGMTQPLGDGRVLFRWFKDADFSTVTHEAAHFLTQFLKDADLVSANRFVGRRLDTPVAKWTRANHEKLARAWERYLSDGIAPTRELRPVFRKMKVWFVDIYGVARDSLGDEIPDDLRAVFDRWMSDEAQRRGNALYQMNDEYDNAPDGSIEAIARDKVSKTIDEAEAKLRSGFEKELRGQAAKTYDDDPFHRAVSEMKEKGNLPGRGIKHSSISADWDVDTIRMVSRKYPGLISKRGDLTVDDAALAAGFESGDDFIQALLSTPTRAEYVEGFIEDGMKAYSDNLQLSEIDLLAARVQAEIEAIKESEPSLIDLVIATKPEGQWNYVESEGRKRVSEITTNTDYANLQAAIRMAARNARSAFAEGKRVGARGQAETGKVTLDRAKERMRVSKEGALDRQRASAEQKIERMRVSKEGVLARQRASAEQKIERISRDWMWRALQEKLKQKQLLENLKARIQARDETNKLISKIKNISRATNLPLDYREQIAGILSSVGARQIRTPDAAGRLPLSEWARRKEDGFVDAKGDRQSWGDGEIFDIDYGQLESLRGKTIQQMSLDELRMLHRVLNEIYTKGRNTGKLLAGKEKASVEMTASGMAARIAEKHSAKAIAGRSIKYDGRTYPIYPNPGMSDEEKNIVAGLRAVLEHGGRDQAIEDLTEILNGKPEVSEPRQEMRGGRLVDVAAQPEGYDIPDEMRADIEAQLAAVKSFDPAKIEMPPATLRPWAQKEARIKRVLAGADVMLAELLQAETGLAWADGFTEKFGPNWLGIYKRINDGYNLMYRLNNEDLPAFEAALKPFKTKLGGLSDWAEKKFIFPELGGAYLTKMEMVSWALNCGNEGNYNSLKKSFKVRGRQLDDKQVGAVLAKLSSEEWDMIEKLGRVVDKLERFDAMDGVYQTMTGNRLEKVQGWKVPHAPREMEGWYYPIIDDPKGSYVMEKRHALTYSDISQMMVKYNPKLPRKGMTNKRQEGAAHILDMNFPAVIARALQDRNRYIALTLPIRDSIKLVNNDTWRTAVESYLGQPLHRMMMPWIQDLARPQSEATTWIERSLAGLRQGSVMVHIGLILLTAFKHYPMLGLTIDRVGLPAVSKAIGAYMRHPREVREFIEQRSPYMQGILSGWDRDIAEKLRNFDPSRSELKDMVTTAAFVPIDTVIGQVARITWTAAYSKAMEELGWDEPTAIDYADKAVRDTVGSFDPKDLSAVRRGSQLRKLITMFGTFGESLAQRIFERSAQMKIQGPTGFENKSGAPGWGRGARTILGLSLLFGMLGIFEALTDLRRPPGSASEVAEGVGEAASSSLPWGRSVFDMAIGKRAPEITPVEEFGRKLFDISKWAHEEHPKWGKHIFESALTVAGYAAKLPTDFIDTLAEGIYNAGEPGWEPWNLFIKPPYEEHGKGGNGQAGFGGRAGGRFF